MLTRILDSMEGIASLEELCQAEYPLILTLGMGRFWSVVIGVEQAIVDVAG